MLMGYRTLSSVILAWKVQKSVLGVSSMSVAKVKHQMPDLSGSRNTSPRTKIPVCLKHTVSNTLCVGAGAPQAVAVMEEDADPMLTLLLSALRGM